MKHAENTTVYSPRIVINTHEETQLQPGATELSQDSPLPLLLNRLNSISRTEKVGLTMLAAAAVTHFAAGIAVTRCGLTDLPDCGAAIVLPAVARALFFFLGGMWLTTSREPLSGTEKAAATGFFVSAMGLVIAAGLLGTCSSPSKDNYCTVGSSLANGMEALGYVSFITAIIGRRVGS